jgi:hypothetical protein
LGKKSKPKVKMENNLNFFSYLKKCYSAGKNIRNGTNDFYRFKIDICELIYEGINKLADGSIKEYIITFEKIKLHIGTFDEICDDNLPCLMKTVSNDEVNTLNRKDIKNIYIFNRYVNACEYDVGILMVILMRDNPYDGIPVFYSDILVELPSKKNILIPLKPKIIF